MILLGANLGLHDTSLSAWIDGEFKYIKCERDTGIKHDEGSYFWLCDRLKTWGIHQKDVTAVAYNSHNDILKTFNPIEDCLYVNDRSKYHFGNCFPNILDNVYMLDHHYAHYLSCMERHPCAVISDQKGSNHKISLIIGTKYQEIITEGGESFPCNVGRLLYVVAKKMGIGGIDESDVVGKIMGLQAYGNPIDNFIKEWSALDRIHIIKLIHWIKSLDINATEKNQEWLDIVHSVFIIAYNWQKKLFEVLPKNTSITYSGGIALNVNWNRWLLDEGYNLDINPHVYDGGLSIGCLRFLCDKFGVELKINNFPYIQDDEAPKTKPSDETLSKVAELLSHGKIVGWYQGHGELGPRALGNRSILMNPSVKDGKDILNEKVKHREWWRPFGASVKQDKASEYFDLDNSPYMLYTAKVLRDDLPSITHVDGTCRHQTVTPEQNALFYDLLDAFESKTGLPVLLNTSLNVGGKPIAGKIEEAIELFKTSDMDALCVGDELYVK